jgi:hypothetical protein
MLGRHNVFEMLPFRNDNLSQLSKVNKAEEVSFLTFEPSIFVRGFSSAFGVLLNLWW